MTKMEAFAQWSRLMDKHPYHMTLSDYYRQGELWKILNRDEPKAQQSLQLNR